jgi:hypothetical protein
MALDLMAVDPGSQLLDLIEEPPPDADTRKRIR